MARKDQASQKLRMKMKDALLKRIKEGHDRKEYNGKGFFKSDLKDVTFWNCKEGEHIIDIIPYIAGPNDPFNKEGEAAYVLSLYVHGNVGPKDEMIICNAETFGKPCPICEHRKQLQRESDDEDLIRELTPSRYPRSVYNIVCYDSVEEEEKGVQVWHTSSYLMEQYILELSKKPTRSNNKEITGFIPFADPDEGKSIAFTRQGTKSNTKFIGHRFVDRDYVISDEILEAAYVLDELIHIPDYDEVYKLYWGEVSDEKEDVKERTEEHTSKSVAKIRKVKRKNKQELDGESKDCPEGGTFGVDIDNFDYCEECDLWTKCAQEADKIEKEKNS